MKYIAKYLSISYISVYEVATFYTMFHLAPVGKYFVQVCTTSPCLIRGADKLVKVCKEKISQKENEISKDDLLPEVKELLNKALAGDADAQLFLGQRYQEGNGVDENKEEAIKWLKLSAEQGNVYAPYILKKMEESAAD